MADYLPKYRKGKLKKKYPYWLLCNQFLTCVNKEFCRHSKPHWYREGYCFEPCEEGQTCITIKKISKEDIKRHPSGGK